MCNTKVPVTPKQYIENKSISLKSNLKITNIQYTNVHDLDLKFNFDLYIPLVTYKLTTKNYKTMLKHYLKSINFSLLYLEGYPTYPGKIQLLDQDLQDMIYNAINELGDFSPNRTGRVI